MPRPLIISLTLLLVALIEVYFFQAVLTVARDFSGGKRQFITYLYWSLALLGFGAILVTFFYSPAEWSIFWRNYLFAPLVILLMLKVVGSLFLLIDDIIRVINIMVNSVPDKLNCDPRAGVSRIRFLSYISLGITFIPYISLIYGMFRGAYKFRVHKVSVKSTKLPAAFHGLKIVQVSDIHTGSFNDTSALEKAFDIVMQQGADIIFFTGDLVNNRTEETKGFIPVYQKLKAPMGVYSILGNHDYGDYVQWDSAEAKRSNLEALKEVHAESGWRLMLNEHIALEKDGEKIALLGVENWGGNLRFPKYGKLKQAHEGTETYPFKILLSHDPSHWDKQVLPEYNDIDLTLSGHTHGMQFGIEIPGFRWSPSQYFYPNWAGLYHKEGQYLYVNRGLGFLGYPGRLGIWPEITVIELQKA